MFVTFSNLVFTVLVYPLIGLGSNGSSGNFDILLLGLLLQAFYFTWCYYQFQPAFLKGKLVKAFVMSFLGVALWMVISMAPMAIFIYRGWDFYKMFFRMF